MIYSLIKYTLHLSQNPGLSERLNWLWDFYCDVVGTSQVSLHNFVNKIVVGFVSGRHKSCLASSFSVVFDSMYMYMAFLGSWGFSIPLFAK